MQPNQEDILVLAFLLILVVVVAVFVTGMLTDDTSLANKSSENSPIPHKSKQPAASPKSTVSEPTPVVPAKNKASTAQAPSAKKYVDLRNLDS